MSEILGGYTVLGDAPPSPSGEARKHVRCNGCGGTCIRTVGSLKVNKGGCANCRNRRASMFGFRRARS